MPQDITQYKDAFLREAKEHIDSMNRCLLELEKNPSKAQLVNDIFREAHTLKSMAATMNYDQMARLCHAVEDVLDGIKRQKIESAECADTLFECFDALELSLKEISRDKGELDTTALVERLQMLAANAPEADLPADRAGLSGEQPAVSAVAKVQGIEVKVERLDVLMNLAEELLINKMRLNQVKESLQNSELSAAVDALGRLITEVQYNVMQSRLVPIGFVFKRFPRMVRDLAKQMGKEVDIQMEGGDIELDRSVIDEIGESLVHLLRNAVDHGIERPEERTKAGKPPQGTIILTAAGTRNLAVIKVADDGAGVDFGEIKDMGIRRGILSPGATPAKVMDAVFSGISTTKQVTAVSGRGFGLNIVKNKIESLGGAVKLESESGKGTKSVMEIPLTLAVIKVLLVRVGGRPYAIPIASIARLVTVNRESIKGMMDYEAIVLNGEDIPLTRLDALFGRPALELDKQPVVIIRRGEEKLGLVVDAFLSTQEIVIKPPNKLVRGNRYFAGSTIIGSGEVVLILDVTNLILSKRVQPIQGSRFKVQG